VFSKKSTTDEMLPLNYILSHKLDVLTKHSKKADTDSPSVGLIIARELCKVLIAAYPDAARKPIAALEGLSGRPLLPLHIAIENGWPCHDLLLSVFPESLEMADPRTGLFPFQTAASYHGGRSNGSENQEEQENVSASPLQGLDATFELLRSNPLSCSIEVGSSFTSISSKTARMI
jgi:hypothetical protein